MQKKKKRREVKDLKENETPNAAKYSFKIINKA